MSSETKIHLVLSMLQTAALVAFIVFSNTSFQVRPGDVKMAVEKGNLDVLSEMKIIEARLAKAAAKDESFQIWINTATSSLLKIQSDMKARASRLDQIDEDLLMRAQNWFTREDFQAFKKKNPNLNYFDMIEKASEKNEYIKGHESLDNEPNELEIHAEFGGGE